MYGNVFRVEFPGRAESVRAFTNALQEYIDGVQMLQARGLASLGDAIENADRSPSVDTVRQGDFTQRLNRFISGFSKNANTATDWDNSASRGLRRGMETIGDNYRTEQKQSEYDSSAEYSSPMYQLYMEDNERNGFAQPDDIPEKPRFCPNCGKPTDVDGRFCRYCGRKLY